MKKVIFFVLVVFVVAGVSCDFSFAEDRRASSEILRVKPEEKNGILDIREGFLKGENNVVIFFLPVHLAFYNEMEDGGGCIRLSGMASNGKILNEQGIHFGKNKNNTKVALFQILKEWDKVKDHKFLLSTKDGSYLVQLDGKFVPIHKGNGHPGYDPEKFDNDEAYRMEIYNKYGKTLSEIKQIWDSMAKYYQARGFLEKIPEGNVSVLDRNSEGAKVLAREMQSRFYAHKMGNSNGEIRYSHTKTDDYAADAVLPLGAGYFERFGNNFSFDGVAIGASIATANPLPMAGDIINFFVNIFTSIPRKNLRGNFASNIITAIDGTEALVTMQYETDELVIYWQRRAMAAENQLTKKQ